ncbi:hypothetical protein AAZX31_05G061200 [Glycine max]|nr:hypothetical protein GLYMA_05G063300v4 [Glycine max]KAH1133080.1 hypothetical protein GYH30_011765 [Glycine max]
MQIAHPHTKPSSNKAQVHGLLPHSDTSFVTIVHEDHVGGLQLMKDGKWVGVKPNPQALVVNIADFFQVKSLHLFYFRATDVIFLCNILFIFLTLNKERIK